MKGLYGLRETTDEWLPAIVNCQTTDFFDSICAFSFNRHFYIRTLLVNKSCSYFIEPSFDHTDLIPNLRLFLIVNVNDIAHNVECVPFLLIHV